MRSEARRQAAQGEGVRNIAGNLGLVQTARFLMDAGIVNPVARGVPDIAIPSPQEHVRGER